MNNYKLGLRFSVATKEIASIYIEINYTFFQVKNNIPSHFNVIILHFVLVMKGIIELWQFAICFEWWQQLIAIVYDDKNE
jgi:hypothetical protein